MQRTPLQRALCGVLLPSTSTRAQVQAAYDLAVYDGAWSLAARIRAALDLF